MFKQKIIFHNNTHVIPSSFFERGISSFVENKGNYISGKSVSFDTYFNSLDYSKLLLNLGLESFYFEITFKGEARLKIKVRDSANSETTIQDIILYSKTNFSTIKSDSFDINNLPKNGICYITIECSDLFQIKEASFKNDTDYRNKVSTCIVICTYKREKFVLRNIETLKEKCKDFISHVFIIDNGNTLPIDDINDDFITIVPNKNYGGSGGFSRGMFEAYKGGYSHMLLMDDDVLFHPESIFRATQYAAYFNEDHKSDWVGFSMFSFNYPCIQHERGAIWDGRVVLSVNHGLDMSRSENLCKNTTLQKYQYSAWWSLLMPTSVVKERGLSMPFFIKLDDIEYSLRAKDKNILFSNGLGVWHEDFESKYNVALEYYVFRNTLVVNALYINHGFLYYFFRFIGKCIKNLSAKKYHELELYNIAMRDYLKGTKFFINCDIEKKHRVITYLSKKNHVSFLYICKLLCKSFNTLLLFIVLWYPATRNYKRHYKDICSMNYWEKKF